MTEQEALEHAQHKLEVYKAKVENGYCFYRRVMEFWKTVVEALKKQVQKKPIVKHYENGGEKPYVKMCCPNGCAIQLYPVTDRHMSYEHEYCPKCGQHLDWTKGEGNDD